MASYKIVWRASAERELRKLPREVVANMVGLAVGGSLMRRNALRLLAPYQVRLTRV